MSPRRATALLCLVGLLCAPAAALADGDPASDVLLIQDVYLPYSPQPSKPLAKALTGLVASVKRAGYPMKVALIETRGDLGAYPELFGQQQRYAKLLASEIVFRVHHPHLLVVMASGFGALNLGPKATGLLRRIKVDQGAQSDGLVSAALQAVAKVASANGHPTQVPRVQAAPASKGSGSSSHTALYVVAAIIVVLGIALIAVSVRTRRSA
ncbi:MAG: hypothetical protein JWM71_2272 [Solirubrobacteraceae bacterium]|nr:hypothetical protein [Solirubrobacteraceae bacterium]